MPRGFLWVHSVDTEEQARELLLASCPTNTRGEYLAPELLEEQTLENLGAFGARLRDVEAKLRACGHPAFASRDASS